MKEYTEYRIFLNDVKGFIRKERHDLVPLLPRIERGLHDTLCRQSNGVEVNTWYGTPFHTHNMEIAKDQPQSYHGIILPYTTDYILPYTFQIYMDNRALTFEYLTICVDAAFVVKAENRNERLSENLIS